MIDGGTAAALGGVLALAVNGYGTLMAKRASEKAVDQTRATSNGFAAGVKGDLAAIRAHLAMQDNHLLSQDEQLASIAGKIKTHDDMLSRLMDDGR